MSLSELLFELLPEELSELLLCEDSPDEDEELLSEELFLLPEDELSDPDELLVFEDEPEELLFVEYPELPEDEPELLPDEYELPDPLLSDELYDDEPLEEETDEVVFPSSALSVSFGFPVVILLAS